MASESSPPFPIRVSGETTSLRGTVSRGLDGQPWLEVPAAGCGGRCRACGLGRVMPRRASMHRLPIPPACPVSEGELLTLEVSTRELNRAAFWLYLMPAVGALAGALIGDGMAGDLGAVTGGALGAGLGLWLGRWRAMRRPLAWQRPGYLAEADTPPAGKS